MNNDSIIWHSEQLEQALGINVHEAAQGREIQFNSQHVKKGDIFIALKGNNSDGHNYIEAALGNGASLAIISDKSFKSQLTGIAAEKILLVDDCSLALEKLAAYKRANSKAKFIGVTGSVGKTSTKEVLKIILSSYGKTFASRGNFNNNLGVTLNLASMPDDIDYAVIEMGMNNQGEISELTRKVKPDIAIITSISEGHLEFFKDVKQIASSKAEIFEGLLSAGHAIIPADNRHYLYLKDHLQELAIHNIYSFALDNKADAAMNSYKIIDDKVEVNYCIRGENFAAKLPLISKHQASNITIALLVVKILNHNLLLAIDQLSKIVIGVGRGEIINIDCNGKFFKIISDYYNANPESLKAALNYLQYLPHPNKVAILGDMLELGENSLQMHIDLVPHIKNTGIKKLFLIGPKMSSIARLFVKSAIKIKLYNNVDESFIDIENLLDNDELILIKASRSIGLDKIVTYLKRYTQNLNSRFLI